MTYNFDNETNKKRLAIIIKELENSPATSIELAKETGFSQLVVLHFIRHLIESKYVYIESYANAPGKGFAKIYALGDKPNANKLDYLSPRYKYRPREKREKFIKPRADIAAQWMMNPC